jgi:hypothetical protein
MNVECRLKGAFLNLSSPPFQLIKTILWENRNRPPGPYFVYQKNQRFLVSLERDSVVKKIRSRDEEALRGSHNASINREYTYTDEYDGGSPSLEGLQLGARWRFALCFAEAGECVRSVI